MSTADSDGRDPLTWLPAEWSRFLTERGVRDYRALQVFRWIHKRGVADPAAMTDLGKPVRAALAEAGLSMPGSVAELRRDPDGTSKVVIALDDGARIESVLIPPLSHDESERADHDDETDNDTPAPARRVTQCISTQVGCAMGCAFCASGIAGLHRNLRASEIVAQVLLGRAHLSPGHELRNVVLMGMGEPLHNYGNTALALRLLTHAEGIGLSTRRVTVSTSGLVPEIDRLGADFKGSVALAVSLHATDDDLRSTLMPINRRYPLAELMAALRRYPMPARRRITIEYTLIAGVNDSLSQARSLARLLRGLPVKVNLIPMNPVASTPFHMSSNQNISAFQHALREAGYTVFVRRQRGDEVAAACGQLALQGTDRRVRRLSVLPTDRASHV